VGSDHQEPFEFHANLIGLEQSLAILHDSVQLLRDATGRAVDDLALMLFETALGEIGANVLTHGRPDGSEQPIAYVLRLEEGKACASFVDHGLDAQDQLTRQMPDASNEAGRGIAIARSLLDDLGYQRVGGMNTWRLVKRL
jgi:serine/threonine-protein kinase RsbW